MVAQNISCLALLDQFHLAQHARSGCCSWKDDGWIVVQMLLHKSLSSRSEQLGFCAEDVHLDLRARRAVLESSRKGQVPSQEVGVILLQLHCGDGSWQRMVTGQADNALCCVHLLLPVQLYRGACKRSATGKSSPANKDKRDV